MKLYLTGGFLGSGKTTAIYNACLELIDEGIKPAVITNDQGNELVDTQFIRCGKMPALEVPGGCFCCNYKQLDQHIETLQQTHHPEIIFAESVGSCTDLVATVVKPFLQSHPQIEVVLSVFSDACVLSAMIKGSHLFVESVKYIYKKQLEEADVLVVNKTDLLTAPDLEEINVVLKKEYPNKKVIYQNSLERGSIQNWLSTLKAFQPKKRKSLDLDYHIYGSGEAELAWLDAQIEIYTTEHDAVSCAVSLINKIYLQINNLQLSIGHLKFLIDDGVHQKKISFTSINQSILKYELIEFRSSMIKVLINARVQSTSVLLEKIVTDAIRELKLQTDCGLIENKMTAFKPGYPKPAYRILN
jgi:G3E family GTPase